MKRRSTIAELFGNNGPGEQGRGRAEEKDGASDDPEDGAHETETRMRMVEHASVVIEAVRSGDANAVSRPNVTRAVAAMAKWAVQDTRVPRAYDGTLLVSHTQVFELCWVACRAYHGVVIGIEPDQEAADVGPDDVVRAMLIDRLCSSDMVADEARVALRLAREDNDRVPKRLIPIFSYYSFWKHKIHALAHNAIPSPVQLDGPETRRIDEFLMSSMQAATTDSFDNEIARVVRLQHCPIDAVNLFARFHPFDREAANDVLLLRHFRGSKEEGKAIFDQSGMEAKIDWDKMAPITRDAWKMMIWGFKFAQSTLSRQDDPWRDLYCLMWCDWGDEVRVQNFYATYLFYKRRLPVCAQVGVDDWIVSHERRRFACKGAAHAIATWLSLAPDRTEHDYAVFNPLTINPG